MRLEVKLWINDHPNLPSGTHWVKTLDDEEGQPCLRTYAVNKTKAHGVRVKEVVREYLDKTFIHGDLYFCGAAGYKVNWGDRKGFSYYMPTTTDDNWYEILFRPGMYTEDLFSIDYVNEIFGKYIPYFRLNSNLNIMEYANRYREFGSAELLAKAGYDYLVMNKTVLKLSAKSKKALIHWLIENGEYVKKHKPLYKDIAAAMKRGLSIERYYTEKAIDRYMLEFKSSGFKRTREECETVYNYLQNPKNPQQIGLPTYIDYLELAQEAGYDMTAKSTLYPLNARAKHDNLARQKQIKETRAQNAQFRKIYELLSQYQIKSKDLKIVVPTCTKDFVKWGKKLHNCVGSMGYDEKMAKGNCIIIMVYKNDQPLECCELNKKQKGKGLFIRQLRGEYNQNSNRHDDCENLVNKFISNYKNRQLVGACI